MLAWFAKYACGVDWQMLERMDDVRFVNEGHFARALRFDLNRPSSQTVTMATPDGSLDYRLDSLPLYSVPFVNLTGSNA